MDINFDWRPRQTEGKIALLVGYSGVKMNWAETNFYSNDPAVAYNDPEAFACKDAEACRRYVLAIRKSCQSEGWNIVPGSEQNLVPEVKERLDEIRKKIQATKLPCKKKEDGFTLLAAGVPMPQGAIDLLALDENKANPLEPIPPAPSVK